MVNETIGSPGKAYTSEALINTADDEEGGFDYVDLAGAKQMEIGFQIFSESQAWTSSLKKKLCELAWVVNYINEDGEECVANILETSETITDILKLADVPEDEEIQRCNSSSKDCYAQGYRPY